MITTSETRIDAGDMVLYLDGHLAEICELLAAHSIDPNLTFAVEYDIIDMPLLRFHLYDEPRRVVGASYMIERALRVPLPAWWVPRRSE